MPILRQIFVASTAEDLKDYRAVAVHVIDALGHKPVHMETFGAMAAPSLSACRQLVRQCDAEDVPAALVTSRGRPPGHVAENVTCALLILRGALVIEVTATTLPSTWPARQPVIDDVLRRVSFKPVPTA